MTVKQLWGGILFALVVIVASNSLYVVKETQRGVLLKRRRFPSIPYFCMGEWVLAKLI